MSRRHWGLWVGAVAGLALVLASGASAKTFGGVVPDVGAGTQIRPSRTAHIANLPYGGGPVLHSNRTHLIFWQPAGSGLGYDPTYLSTIEGFLFRVAADSRQPTNVYGLSGQYTDSRGPAAYVSTYGGAVVATNPLPPSGCVEPATAPPSSACMSDLQLEAELERVIAGDHLPTTDHDVYLVVLPAGLGSCETSGPDNCALGGEQAGSYCGYHTSNPDGTILYAVIPYNAVPGHCQSDNPRPNSSPADPTISTISHEHNETITDPLGNAWIDGNFSEDGDLCLAGFGPNLGGSGAGAWNEVIHGGHYYLQEEWSNNDGSCQPRDEADRISLAVAGSALTRSSVRFTGHAHDPDGTIVANNWFFGNGRQARGGNVSHAFARAGVYRVVLRSTDSAGNWTFTARTIRVAKARGKAGRR